MNTAVMKPGPSLALLTDLYQLTMSCGYWRAGSAERRASFHLFFRRHPFGGEFAIACGLATALEILPELRYGAEELEFLRTLRGADERPLYDSEFLEKLAAFQLACDIDAMPEGTAVFAHQPLLRVTGPLWQCQLLETLLLNVVNFQTLIATKAARICLAAAGEPVLEFGLRRAQGVDGGLSASRAAFVGGCSGTSNVLAAKMFGIPARGTHAHSWVLAFDTEQEAFTTYADALPNNCLFLVDTYDTLTGVRRAIRVGRDLRRRGQELLGIRLDSGDLVKLSRGARQELDAAGFPEAKIVASNDLDEYAIRDLKAAGAAIDVWGIGTRLATAYEDPALGGVFKLSAIQDEPGGEWTPRLKLSEDVEKTSNPGQLQVVRYEHQGAMVGDVLFDELSGRSEGAAVLTPNGERVCFPQDSSQRELLVPVMRNGDVLDTPPSVHEARRTARDEIARLPPEVAQLNSPEPYTVGMDLNLHRLKQRLIDSVREHQHETH